MIVRYLPYWRNCCRWLKMFYLLLRCGSPEEKKHIFYYWLINRYCAWYKIAPPGPGYRFRGNNGFGPTRNLRAPLLEQAQQSSHEIINDGSYQPGYKLAYILPLHLFDRGPFWRLALMVFVKAYCL